MEILIIYTIFSLILKITINPRYRYTSFNLLEVLANIFLVAFMEVTSGGKDSHWWDWKETKLKVNSEFILPFRNGKAHIRQFIKLPIVGQYNLSGLRDLFYIIFLLPKTLVIQPKSYKGDWILFARLDAHANTNWMECKFILSGPVKYLMDGGFDFLGKTTSGELIELEVVDIISRYSKRSYLFV